MGCLFYFIYKIIADKVSGIEKLNGIDFGYWKMQIEDYLYGRSCIYLFLGRNWKL